MEIVGAKKSVFEVKEFVVKGKSLEYKNVQQNKDVPGFRTLCHVTTDGLCQINPTLIDLLLHFVSNKLHTYVVYIYINISVRIAI